jgi:hypothetical protein
MTQRNQFAHATQRWISPGAVLVPGHTVASDQRAYGGTAATRAVEPFAGWLRGYQRFAYLRGALLGLILLAGLGGIVRAWRGGGIRRLTGWGGPGLLPWLASLVLLLVPVMTADYSERYALIAVPTACLAAALAFARSPQGEAGGTGRAQLRPAGDHAAGTWASRLDRVRAAAPDGESHLRQAAPCRPQPRSRRRGRPASGGRGQPVF